MLLDDVDAGAANPWGVACTADGATLCVTHAGTHELSVINTADLMKKLAAATAGMPNAPNSQYSGVEPPNDLAFMVDLRQRIGLAGMVARGRQTLEGRTKANGPRGLAIVGTKAYIAAYFSDKLAVVNLAEDPRRSVSLIALGPPPEMTPERFGEMNFHDAWLCFQHWQSCASCHPGCAGRWLELGPDERRTGHSQEQQEHAAGSPDAPLDVQRRARVPKRPSAPASATSSFIGFEPKEEDIPPSVDDYLKSLTPVPSPSLVQGQLSEAAQRGKELFFNEQRLGCAICHPAPLYTNLKSYDVKSRGELDRTDAFDTPTLVECWRTAPYMHDGRYVTLKEVFTAGKHGRHASEIEALTEQEIDDLVEFIHAL